MKELLKKAVQKGSAYLRNLVTNSKFVILHKQSDSDR